MSATWRGGIGLPKTTFTWRILFYFPVSGSWCCSCQIPTYRVGFSADATPWNSKGASLEELQWAGPLNNANTNRNNQIPKPSSASIQTLDLHSASMKCSPSTLPFAAKPAAGELTNHVPSWKEGQMWTKVLEITRINSDTRQHDLYDMMWEVHPALQMPNDRQALKNL